MSNPFAPPQTASSLPLPVDLRNDPGLVRRRIGFRSCGILIGLVLLLLGMAFLAAAFFTTNLTEGLVIGCIGATLMTFGVSAILGFAWALYAIALLALAALAFLAYDVFTFAAWLDEIPRRNAILAIRGMFALPTALLLSLAWMGIAFQRSLRWREAKLAARAHEVEKTVSA